MIEKLMQLLNEHIILRFDPLREKNRFTIIYKNERYCDTDDPNHHLMEIYDNKLRKENPDSKLCYHYLLAINEPPAIIINDCECGENWHCPVCYNGAGSYPHKCNKL